MKFNPQTKLSNESDTLGNLILHSIHEHVISAYHRNTFMGNVYAEFKPFTNDVQANWDSYSAALSILESASHSIGGNLGNEIYESKNVRNNTEKI